jgi:phosphomannomutase
MKMNERQAIVGGEGNGGVIIPEINRARDGLVALAVIVQTISDADKPLSEIARTLPRYAMVKDKIALDRRSWPAARKALRRVFVTEQVDRTDGLKFLGDGYWLHVRPSNTEPVLRIIAEARTDAEAKGLVRRARRALEETTGKGDQVTRWPGGQVSGTRPPDHPTTFLVRKEMR